MRHSSNISAGTELDLKRGISIKLNKNANLATRETRPYEFRACFFGVHVIKRRSDWPESDWPELFGMARTKDSAQRYQTILSAAILLAEVVGWERD